MIAKLSATVQSQLIFCDNYFIFLDVHDKTKRANMIMVDLSDTLEKLFSPDGADYDLLDDDKKEMEDITDHTYTDRDKKILRHYEGASEPAKRLVKFLQDNTTDAWSYVTFELRLALQRTNARAIAIYPDVSRFDRTKDLRNRGEKSVLVKKAGVTACPSKERNYSKVEVMDPLVEKYCSLYTQDLTSRIGLDEEELSAALTFHVILNPMFGKKSQVVGSGLLTSDQFHRTRSGKSNCQ